MDCNRIIGTNMLDLSTIWQNNKSGRISELSLGGENLLGQVDGEPQA